MSKQITKQSNSGQGRDLFATMPALSTLQSEINRTFDTLWHRFEDPFMTSVFGSRLRETAPSIEVNQTEKAFEVTAELPGLTEKDVSVTLADNLLTIKGMKKAENEKKKEDCVYSERRYGAFERSFRLPAEVKEDKIEATFKDGVLTITLPKVKPAGNAAKKIEVKAA